VGWPIPVCADNANEFMAAVHITYSFGKNPKIKTKLNLNIIK
jgi:hypothetical protein